MKRVFCAFVALGCLLRSAADETPCPALTRASMIGTWEAIDTGRGFSVFQISITEQGPSFLVNIWENGHSRACVLESLDATDGKLTLVFRSDETDKGKCGSERAHAIAPVILVEGTGFDCGPAYALFETKVTLAAFENVPEKVMLLSFVRTNEALITERLRRMSKRGEQLQEAYLRGTGRASGSE